MQGNNFILPDRDRVPSVFEALALFFCACAGRLIAGYIGTFVCRVLSYFVYDISALFTENCTSIIYYMVFIVLPVSFVLHRNPGIHEPLRVKPLSNRLVFLCVLAAAAGVMFVTYISYFWLMPIQALGGVIPDNGITIPGTPSGMMITILTSAVMPGVCEELLFRGVILSAYEERGSVKAMFITAFLFMCLHSSVAGMLSEFVAGLVLCFIVISTDSLFAGMIYHTVHNSILLIISYAASGKETADTAEKLYDGIGGVGGIIQLLLMSAAFGAVLLAILYRIDAKRVDRNFGVAAVGRREIKWPELVVLGCCAMLILLFYGVDILGIAGVL